MNCLRLSSLAVVLFSLLMLSPAPAHCQEWKNIPVPSGSLIGLAWNPLDTCEVVGFQYYPARACRSLDGGRTWFADDNLPEPPYLNARFIFHPTSPDTQYFVSQERLEVSVDGGQTWESRRPPGVRAPLIVVDICYSQPNHMLVFAANSHSHQTTWLSDDAGATWSEMESTTSTFDTRFDPFDPSHLFAGGAHGLLHSVDGGASFVPYLTNWEEMELYEIRFFDLDPTRQGTLYISYGQMEQEVGDLFRLTDQTLSGDDYMFSAQEVYVDEGGNVIAEYWQHIEEPHIVIVSSNGGEDWDTPGLWIPYLGHDGSNPSHHLKVFINPLNPSSMFLTNGTNLFLSWNGGYSACALASGIQTAGIRSIFPHRQGALVITSNEQLWQLPEFEVPDFPRSFDFIEDIAAQSDQSPTLYAAGMGLLRSVDGGENFAQLLSAFCPESSPSITTFPGAPDTLLAWQMGGLIFSPNGGNTWDFVTPTGLNEPHHTDLYADRFHHGTVWTAGAGLFRSEDFGQTWERFYTPTSPVIAMYQREDNDDLIVLLEEGRFGSINTFNHFYYDLSPPEELGSVLALALPPDSNQEYDVVLSTETGVYLRYPTGEFVPMNNPVEDVVTALAFDATGDTLYMGTQQSGLWVGWGEFLSSVPGARKELPETTILHPAWPNPFNASTRIAYDLPRASQVRVAVYDLLGRQVALLDQGLRSAGRYEVMWKADAASGSYIVRLQGEGVDQAQKVLLVK